MIKSINIFIPAAGLGERLRPITNFIPKPLIPVLGKPVLQLALEKISALPVNKIGINLHHKKEMIEEWVNKYFMGKGGFETRPYTLFYEEIILGTGGALKNAEEFLKHGAFLVHNSDILSDINLEKLLEHHFSSGNLVTLAVHDYPEFNNVIVDEMGFLKAIETGLKPVSIDVKRCAFTGIAVYEPDFLQFLPSGVSSVVDAWLQAVGAGHKIGTYDVSGCEWSDIGTPETYARTVFDRLRAEGETVYIHPSVKGCEKAELMGYVVIEEGCVITEKAAMRNCILLTGSAKAEHGNCILGEGFEIYLNRSDIPWVEEDGKRLIGSGGSDRKYYRIDRGRKTAVLMECARTDPDFQRQIEYTKFFLQQSVPVPELIEIDFDEKTAVVEDAGDTSLYNWLKCPREEGRIEEMYKKIIDILLNIHTFATDHAASCPMLKNRIFDYEYFRWETDYFIESFVEGTGEIRTVNVTALKEDLNALAFKADSFPKTVIHRDFQSQNIMVTPDGSLKIIDYQGARMGPSAYDVASILWDPYYRLEDNMRERLVDYYISKIEDVFDADYFRETLLVCRLQRHMQALGAYGFLSSAKGKKYFLKYVPEGLRLLKEDIALSANEYPELFKLIMNL